MLFSLSTTSFEQVEKLASSAVQGDKQVTTKARLGTQNITAKGSKDSVQSDIRFNDSLFTFQGNVSSIGKVNMHAVDKNFFRIGRKKVAAKMHFSAQTTQDPKKLSSINEASLKASLKINGQNIELEGKVSNSMHVQGSRASLGTLRNPSVSVEFQAISPLTLGKEKAILAIKVPSDGEVNIQASLVEDASQKIPLKINVLEDHIEIKNKKLLD